MDSKLFESLIHIQQSINQNCSNDNNELRRHNKTIDELREADKIRQRRFREKRRQNPEEIANRTEKIREINRLRQRRFRAKKKEEKLRQLLDSQILKSSSFPSTSSFLSSSELLCDSSEKLDDEHRREKDRIRKQRERIRKKESATNLEQILKIIQQQMTSSSDFFSDVNQDNNISDKEASSSSSSSSTSSSTSSYDSTQEHFQCSTSSDSTILETLTNYFQPLCVAMDFSNILQKTTTPPDIKSESKDSLIIDPIERRRTMNRIRKQRERQRKREAAAAAAAAAEADAFLGKIHTD